MHLATPARGVRYFGPYLGGRAVRSAVSALARVFPLGYAGSAASGSEQDLARLLGTGPDDLPHQLDAVTAVLEGDPVAVGALRARLAAHRHEAAARLRFELAARLQAELLAVDWVSPPSG